MFRIVENSDGSTSILDRLSGKLLTIIPAKNRPQKDLQNDTTQSASVLSPRSNSCNRLPLPSPTRSTATCVSNSQGDKVSLTHVADGHSESPAAKRPAPTADSVRRLRPRNVQPEYNEDKAFEALIHSTNGTVLSPTPLSVSDASLDRKPDHLVVVFKHSPERQAETPNRMRLLPAATLNKLQAGLHQPGKSGTLDPTGPDHCPFPSEPSEPENDCIDQITFNQYLNLIPLTSLTNKPAFELRQKWPLRLHSRSSTPVRSKNSTHSTSRIMQSPVSPKSGTLNSSRGKHQLPESPCRSEVQNLWFQTIKSKEKFVTSQKTPQNVLHVDPKGVLHLIPTGGAVEGNNNSVSSQKQSQNVFTKTSASVSYLPHDQDLFCGLPNWPVSDSMKADQRKMLLKRFVRKYLLRPAENYKPGVEMTSPLGKRLLDAYSAIVNLHSGADVLRLIKSYERNCSTNSLTHKQLLHNIKCSFSSKVKIDFSLPSPSKNNCLTSRILRSQLSVNPASNAWGLKSYHIYVFSKQERLEKWLTMESGLDWKARLLTLQCNDISLTVQKVTRCEVCRQQLDPDVGHSCQFPTPSQVETILPVNDDEQAVITLDDSIEDYYPQNPLVLYDEDDEEMQTEQQEEEEEIILIGGPSSFSSSAVDSNETTSNHVHSNNSPVEVLIEF